MIDLARQRGKSTAEVALANGPNANMQRCWVKEASGCMPSRARHNTAKVVPAFVQ